MDRVGCAAMAVLIVGAAAWLGVILVNLGVALAIGVTPSVDYLFFERGVTANMLEYLLRHATP